MKMILLAFASLTALCASATVNYVVPWYANPVSSDVAFGSRPITAFDEDAPPVLTAWTTVENDTALAGKSVVAKRMSHAKYFRPRFYALCDDGDIIVYTLTNDLAQVKWTTVLSAADLAAAAGVAEGSKATDLYVSDDGAFGFLKYGSAWKSLGYDPPHWTLWILDADGNPATTAADAKAIWRSTNNTDPADVLGSAYVTDGKWKFKCHRPWSSGIFIGDNTATDDHFIAGNLNDHAAEFLDLSRGVAVPGDARYADLDSVHELVIAGNYKGAFADRMRVYVESRNQTSWYNRRGSWQGVEEVVQGSDRATSLSYLSYVPGSVRRLVLDFPNLVSLTSNGQFSNESCVETDFGDWNFPSLTNTWVQNFRNAGGSGVLSLPALRRTADAPDTTSSSFYCCNAEEIRLSAESRSLEHLGSRTFRHCDHLRRVVIGGTAGGFAFNQAGAARTMFPDSAKLVDVVFTGGHPVFTDPTLQVFGTRDGDSKRCNMVFAHPALDDPVYGAEWAAFFSGKTITPLSRAERIAFKAANPGRPVPYGIAGTDVFLTTYDQYVAVIGSENEDLGGIAPSIEWDAAYGSVTVSGAQELEPGGGVYPSGAVVTIAATGENGGSFRKWYGDIGDNDPYSPTIRVPVASGGWIHARFVHPWEITDYDRHAGTAKATDGRFTVNLTEMNASAHTFTLGKPERMGLFDVEIADGGATTNMQIGASTVDFGGAFTLAGDDTPWTATAFAEVRGGATYPYRYEGRIGTFFSPGTLCGRRLWDVFRPDNPSGIKVRTAYPRVFLDEPELPDYLPDYCFAGTVVTQLVLQVPSVRAFRQTVLWDGKMFGDFAWWDLASVEDMDERAWCTQYIQDNTRSFLDGLRAFEMHGALRLPSLRNVRTSPTLGAALSPMPFLQSLELGGRTTVTNIDDRAFAGNSSLTNLVIHADPDIVVGTWIFDDHAGRRNSVEVVYPGHVPERIVFTGEAISETAMNNLLAGVCAAIEKPVKVYVDKHFFSWKSAPYIDHAPTAGERTQADAGELVIGVVRCGAPAPLGKALVIHKGSPYYKPSDFKLFIR